MILFLCPVLAFAAGWWAERKLLEREQKAGLLLLMGLLVLTAVWYFLSEKQPGLGGFEFLFYALVSGCGLLGAGIGWLTKKVEETGEGDGKEP